MPRNTLLIQKKSHWNMKVTKVQQSIPESLNPDGQCLVSLWSIPFELMKMQPQNKASNHCQSPGHLSVTFQEHCETPGETSKKSMPLHHPLPTLLLPRASSASLPHGESSIENRDLTELTLLASFLEDSKYAQNRVRHYPSPWAHQLGESKQRNTTQTKQDITAGPGTPEEKVWETTFPSLPSLPCFLEW